MRLNLILSLSVLLLGWSAYELATSPWRAEGDRPRVSADAAASAPLAIGPSLDNVGLLRDLDAFATTLDRPVFSESRRPYEPPPAAVEAAAAPAEVEAPLAVPKLSLQGIVLSAIGNLAMVADKGGTRRLRVGERFEGWTVAKVTHNAVTLEHAGQSEVFELRSYERDGVRVAESKPADPNARAAQRLAARRGNARDALAVSDAANLFSPKALEKIQAALRGTPTATELWLDTLPEDKREQAERIVQQLQQRGAERQ